MDAKRLEEIEAEVCDGDGTDPIRGAAHVVILELVAEVKRLRAGITDLSCLSPDRCLGDCQVCVLKDAEHLNTWQVS